MIEVRCQRVCVCVCECVYVCLRVRACGDAVWLTNVSHSPGTQCTTNGICM